MSLAAEALLAELTARGVEVRADGGALRLRPASAVPPELVPELRERKSSLLELVRDPELELAARILAILAAGPATSKAIALRLGRPRDVALYEALARLHDRGEIATDARSCAFYLPGTVARP